VDERERGGEGERKRKKEREGGREREREKEYVGEREVKIKRPLSFSVYRSYKGDIRSARWRARPTGL